MVMSSRVQKSCVVQPIPLSSSSTLHHTRRPSISFPGYLEPQTDLCVYVITLNPGLGVNIMVFFNGEDDSSANADGKTIILGPSLLLRSYTQTQPPQ